MSDMLEDEIVKKVAYKIETKFKEEDRFSTLQGNPTETKILEYNFRDIINGFSTVSVKYAKITSGEKPEKTIGAKIIFVSRSGFMIEPNVEQKNYVCALANQIYNNPRMFLEKYFTRIAGYLEYKEKTTEILGFMLQVANDGLSVKLNKTFADFKNSQGNYNRYTDLADQIIRCFNEEFDKTDEAKRVKAQKEENGTSKKKPAQPGDDNN